MLLSGVNFANCPVPMGGMSPIAVTANAAAGQQPFDPEINFENIGTLGGLGAPFINNPTSLTFGADGRLYVTQQSGQIQALSIDIVDGQLIETAPRETLVLPNGLGVVQGIINHDDDGSIFDGEAVNAGGGNAFNARQVTGIVASQDTNGNPLFYISSSDPRISAGGSSGAGVNNNGRADTNLDTNSGTITRVTATPDGSGGFVYDAVDIVRGLPRSEENHSVNGLVLNEEDNSLLVTVGGFTNNGSPSAFFSFTSEFVLAGTVLEIDLDAIEDLPILTDDDAGQPTSGSQPTARQFVYDLPTLDDPNQANAPAGLSDAQAAAAGFFENSQGLDLQGPFGGNDGFNQAILPQGAPVRIFADGLRNAFDLVQTTSGQIFTVDNGGNGNLGAEPVIINGVATNLPAELENPPQFGSGDPEPLFQITEGEFFGHGSPTRGNQDGALAILNDQGVPFAEGSVFNLDAGLFIQSTVDDVSTLVPEGLVGNGTGQIEAGFLIDPSQFANFDQLNNTALENRLTESGITVQSAIGNTINPASNAIATVGSSTNGIAEFTGDAFGGALQGALVVTQFNDNVTVLNINDDGTALDPLTNAGDDLIFGTADDVIQSQNGVFSIGAGINNPLDVIVGAAGTPVANTFENVVLVAAFGADNIFALAPSGFEGSDDTDIDNDGVLNVNDPFTRDASNGGSVVVNPGQALVFDFDDNSDNNQPGPDGLVTGLTGVAINGVADFEDSLDQPSVFLESGSPRPNQDFTLDNVRENTAAGGGANVIELVSNGTAVGDDNDGEFLFQTGVTLADNVSTFTVNFALFNPGNSFDPNDTSGNSSNNGTQGSFTPNANQEVGGFIGDGGQSNFLRVVVTDNAALGEGFLIALENNDATSSSQQVFIPAPALFANQPVNQNPINISLTVDLSTPGAESAVAIFSFLAANGDVITVDNASNPIALAGTNLLNAIQGNQTLTTESGDTLSSGLAVGLFSTNGNAPEGEAFSAIYDEISITATSGGAAEGGPFVAGDVVLAVNAGGPALTQVVDGENITFSADDGVNSIPNGVVGSFSGSSTFTDGAGGNGLQPIFEDTVFATERFGSGLQFQAAGLEQGNYIVDLYFAEIFFESAGDRVFDVSVEGETVLDNFDILSQTGGDFNQSIIQRTEAFTVSSDGVLNIDFDASANFGKLSAVVIREAVSSTPAPAPTPAPTGPVRIQAEDFDLQGDFVVNGAGAADGGQLARVPFNGGTGTAITDLSGVALGTNDLTITVFDENDGESQITVQILRANGNLETIASVVLDQDGGGNGTQAQNLRTIALGSVDVQAGDQLVLEAAGDDGEAARIDFVEFVANTVSGDIVLAVNAGGPTITQTINGESITFGANTLGGGSTTTQNGVTATFLNGSQFVDSSNGNGLQPVFTDTVFGSERFGANLQFQAAGLAPGDYVVDLYFAEIFFGSEGRRVFDVSVEGQTVLDNFDILTQTGGDVNQSIIQRTDAFTVSSDGVLNIDLNASVNNGKLSAIVIREA